MNEVEGNDFVFMNSEGKWTVILCETNFCSKQHHRDNPLQYNRLVSHFQGPAHGFSEVDVRQVVRLFGREGESVNDSKCSTKKYVFADGDVLSGWCN